MTAAQILQLISYLTALGRRILIEDREATAAEMARAGIDMGAAIDDLDAAIEEAGA